MSEIICQECGCDEGTLLKEFDNDKNYYWSELIDMTNVCVSCGSENLKEKEWVHLKIGSWKNKKIDKIAS